MIITLCIIGYVLGMFITFFIACYTGAKKNYGNKEYTYEVEGGTVAASIFWPLTLAFFIVVAPFELIKKLAMKAKKAANPEKYNEFKLNI